MLRQLRARALILCLSASASVAATVSVTASSATVAEKGWDTFTVTVSPGTNVQTVTLTYEGESSQDQGSSSPYVVSRQFNTAMLGLTVTATVTYNGDQQDVATTDIDVVGLSLTGNSSPSRGWPSSYIAQSKPPGLTLSAANWSLQADNGLNSYTDPGGTIDRSVWSGAMVVDGTISCSATVSGVPVQASRGVIINPRKWATPISCAQDNEPDWGDPPMLGTPLGRHRDRDTNFGSYYFVPRNSAADFSPARTIAMVASGPCAGWWYVVSSTLKCQRETVISKYIKSTGPALGGVTFGEANQYCFTTSVGAFVQAVKNHEYRGTPDMFKSYEGHHGRTELSIIDLEFDPKVAIESITSRNQLSLEAAINSAITQVEADVEYGAADEMDFWTFGFNWGSDPEALGAGLHALWNGYYWTDCVNPSKDF